VLLTHSQLAFAPVLVERLWSGAMFVLLSGLIIFWLCTFTLLAAVKVYDSNFGG